MPTTYEQCLEVWIDRQCRRQSQPRQRARCMGRPVGVWTRARDKQMRALAATGKTANEIAQAMGLQRQQVASYASKCHIQTGGGRGGQKKSALRDGSPDKAQSK